MLIYMKGVMFCCNRLYMVNVGGKLNIDVYCLY